MLTRVHHVGLVVRRLEDGLAFWQDVLGLHVSKQATVRDQGVRAALLPIGRSEIELLEPIGADGGVAKFLERRGEGLHHVCFETPDVAAELAAARAKGLPLIDEAPRQGLAGMICFLHPKGTRGVLVELATPPPGEHAPPAASTGPLAGLALEEVTARSRDAASAADLFAGQLGLAREACGAEAGLAAAAVSAGGVRLRFVSADPRSAGAEAAELRAAAEEGEGLAALVLAVRDLPGAAAALAALDPARAAGAVRLRAERCHGVPLTLRPRSPEPT
jgi:methylmalonyl-CoA/ethylmalonyl-CoA epimerase